MATVPQTIECRRAPRDLVSFRSVVESADGSFGSMLMVDMSPYGFMARCGLPLQRDDEVVVTLPVIGPRRAVVRWALGGRLGGEFAEPLPAHNYARMLAKAPHDRPGWNEV